MTTLDSDRWRQICGVLGDLLDAPTDERERRLAEIADQDPEMGRELESLLIANDRSISLFDAPDLAGALAETEVVEPTTQTGQLNEPWPRAVGTYRLVRKLGQGGMGTVFLGEQYEPVHRRVAIKLISQARLSARTEMRFELERNALATLSHPYIAQLFEAGATDQGIPYFVMELVEGTTITQYAAEKTLSISERLQLMIQVCTGVWHAHQKGILHRDLKPANIMITEIDRAPMPKIIDFGIAKAVASTEAERLTEAGVVGTFAYMSPEALQVTDEVLDLDIRSDVYSLGIVLFELLIGVRPFQRDSESILGWVRRAGEEVPRPSTVWRGLDADERSDLTRRRGLDTQGLQAHLEGELDWIVLKALARERDERYASVVELAQDLGRFLNDEPILAKPPSTGYLARKFVRRHRVGVAATAFAAIMLLAGVGGIGVGWVRAERAEARALEEADRANREAVVAGEVANFLVGLFRQADPFSAMASLQESSDDEVTAREILDRGAEGLTPTTGLDPAIRSELLFIVGKVYLNLGVLPEARSMIEQGLAARRELYPADHVKIADGLSMLGALEREENNLAAASELLEQALEIYRGVDEPSMGKAFVYRFLGVTRESQGRYDEAEALMRRAVTIHEALGEQHLKEKASLLTDLGKLLRELGKYDEAEARYLEALALKRRILGEHPETAGTLGQLGDLNRDRGTFEEAEAYYRESLALAERFLDDGSTTKAVLIHNFGWFLHQQGELDEAEQRYARALDLYRKNLGDRHSVVARGLNTMAFLRHEQGRFQEAETLYREALDINRERLGPEHSAVAVNLNNLARVQVRQGKPAEAEALINEALSIFRRALSPDHWRTANAEAVLGSIRTRQGRHRDAEQLLLRAYDIVRELKGEDSAYAREIASEIERLYAGWDGHEPPVRVTRSID